MDRQQLASLAHAKAHEVCALREAMAKIAPDMGAEDVRRELGAMIATRQQQITLIGGEAGHA